MRRAMVWLAMFLVGGAIAVACSSSSVSERWDWTETQSLTRGPPDAGTAGIDIGRATGFRVHVCPVGADRITGGSISSYVYIDGRSQWSRNPRQERTAQGSEWRLCETFDDEDIAYRGPARLLPAANGVTVLDGGSLVQVRVEAWAE